jgi:Ser/Thr protein kinase RdoA (MazF antagonist)
VVALYFRRNIDLQKQLNLAMIHKWVSYFTVSDEIRNFNTASYGQENIVLILTGQKGNNYVLKIYSMVRTHFMIRYTEQIMEREIAFAMFLRERNLPVPPFIQTKDGSFYVREQYGESILFVTLCEYVKGSIAYYTLSQMREMAALQAKLHKASLAFPAEKYYKEPMERYSMLAYRMKQIKPITAKRFPSDIFNKLQHLYTNIYAKLSVFYKESEKVFIHCDIKFDNMLMNGSRIKALLDFGDMRYSVIHEDIGASIFYMTDYFHDRKIGFWQHLSFYLRSYEKESGRSLSNLDKTIILYYAVDRFLIWNLFYLAEDQHDEKEVAYQARIAKKHMRLIEKLFMFFGQKLEWQ